MILRLLIIGKFDIKQPSGNKLPHLQTHKTGSTQRNINTTYISLICTVLLIMLSGETLLAHQKKEAVSRIIFNEHMLTIEIIHRFLLHDTEHASKQLFSKGNVSHNANVLQQYFVEYAGHRFSLKRLTNEELPLKNIGFEVEGPYLWIYQETPLLPDIKGLLVSHGALTEIWPEHVNLINVERDKKVRSLIFKSPASEQKISFETKQ